LQYKWNIHQSYQGDFFDVIKKEKNLTDDDLYNFIHIRESKYRNPNLLPNIDKAIERTKQAIQNHEHILISGDYDCDGITSTSIMMIGLSSLTPYVEWTVPERTDGYGLSKKIVDNAIQNHINLIITVDNGISTKHIIDYANENQIDVIVTDHHPMVTSDVLPTEITVDPQIEESYPFKSICGCMVAYKFLRMLISDLPKKEIHNEIVVLTMFGTIADVMSLTDENRKFVYNGLKLLNQKQHISYGIDALVKALKLSKGNITSTNIAFSIAPCINALGRIDDSKIGVELFLADDEVKATRLAEKSASINEKRKQFQNEALQNIEIDNNSPFIIETIDNKYPGLIGAIAGKFANKYQKPCFMLHELTDGRLSGSGRTIGNFAINTCISDNMDICTGGGHASACGITMKKDDLQEFKKRCFVSYNKYLEDNRAEIAEPTKDFLCELNFNDIDDELMSKINTLEPFGKDNPMPEFCSHKVLVQDYKILGALQNTVKLELYQNGKILTGITFNETKDKFVEELNCPKYINIGYTLNYNYWRGNRTLQLLINDFQVSG